MVNHHDLKEIPIILIRKLNDYFSSINSVYMEKVGELNKNLSLDYTGFDINDEHPVFYRSVDSKTSDFYIIHVYTPEHFTLLRYIDVGGVVTTHLSTINNKHELADVILKSSHSYKQLRVISREEYLNFKNIYDNYMKSIHI